MPVITKRTRPKRGRPSKARAEIARRVHRILRTEPHYIYHASFDGPGAAELILNTPFQTREHRATNAAGKGADFYVAFLYQTDLMSREEEFHLFRKMNYLKFRAYRLRHGLDPQTATLARVEEIESMENDAARIRNFIIESNLRLVTSRAKQFARTTGLPLDELISEGNIGLVQAVEHFDFARGTKLSTYATWAVTNKLLAFMQKARRQSAHFVGEHGVSLDAFEGSQESTEDSLANAEVREKLTSFLSRLKDRERAAVEYRFGLTENGEARTLKELASEWGVTKQRAQQVCASAVNKLRLMLQQEGLFALWN